MQKLKDEAEQKITNEHEAVVRDYYVRLLNEKKRLTKEYDEALRSIREKESMMDDGNFEIKNSMERDGLSIVFSDITIR